MVNMSEIRTYARGGSYAVIAGAFFGFPRCALERERAGSRPLLGALFSATRLTDVALWLTPLAVLCAVLAWGWFPICFSSPSCYITLYVAASLAPPLLHAFSRRSNRPSACS